MDVKELRIGNWLLTEREIPQQVAYVGETIGFHNETGGTDKHQHNPIFSYDIEKIKPIPLTGEILEKAGFKQHLHLWKIKGVTGFTIEKRASRFYLKEYKIDANPIQTVHHLQNLYYAIKQEELKLEL